MGGLEQGSHLTAGVQGGPTLPRGIRSLPQRWTVPTRPRGNDTRDFEG